MTTFLNTEPQVSKLKVKDRQIIRPEFKKVLGTYDFILRTDDIMKMLNVSEDFIGVLRDDYNLFSTDEDGEFIRLHELISHLEEVGDFHFCRAFEVSEGKFEVVATPNPKMNTDEWYKGRYMTISYRTAKGKRIYDLIEKY